MKLFGFYILFCLVMLTACSEPAQQSQTSTGADYVFKGNIFTAEETAPFARAVVVKDNRIIAVEATDTDLQMYIDSNTEVIELGERLLVPGFIDGHTHFNQAGKQLSDANLLKIDNDQALSAELKRVTRHLDDGEWITGGSWGAYEVIGYSVYSVIIR